MFESILGQFLGNTALVIFLAFILRVIFCIVAYIIGQKLITIITRSVSNMMMRSSLQEGAVTFAGSILKIALYCILIAWIAMQFGVEETSIAALVASAGIAVGLSMQGGLSNLVGGFLILFFQPFRIGDYIITQGQEGTVSRIEIMYTTLLTVSNCEVIVPNGNLANNVIVNNTSAEKRRIDLRVGISYDDDPETAKSVLIRLAQTTENVLTEDEIIAFVAELGESSVVMGLRCWVYPENYFPVLWKLNEDIKSEFEKAGVHIPYPQMDVHVKDK